MCGLFAETTMSRRGRGDCPRQPRMALPAKRTHRHEPLNLVSVGRGAIVVPTTLRQDASTFGCCVSRRCAASATRSWRRTTLVGRRFPWWSTTCRSTRLRARTPEHQFSLRSGQHSVISSFGKCAPFPLASVAPRPCFPQPRHSQPHQLSSSLFASSGDPRYLLVPVLYLLRCLSVLMFVALVLNSIPKPTIVISAPSSFSPSSSIASRSSSFSSSPSSGSSSSSFSSP